MKTDRRMLGVFVRAQVEFMYKAGRFATARDLFLFSLYACGISFVDLVYLRPENLKDGYLVYTRRKTGRQIVVKLTSAMQGILARYAPESRGYLFPFLDDKLSPLQNYGRYCSALALYNRRLKRLGLSLGKRQTRKGKSLVVKFFRKFFQCSK